MRNDKNLDMNLEILEDRVMLSTIDIFVSGDTGQESFDLEIDGQVVMSYENIGTEDRVIRFLSPQVFTADQIRVQFTNDVFDPNQGIDRNLNVDKIEVDGTVYETESITTFSTATWTPEDGIQPGYGRGETLHTDGYFQYASGSEIAIRASGDMGTESLNLQVDGQTVATFAVTTTDSTYIYNADEILSPDRIRIEFTGDQYDPANEIDTNLNVDWIEIDRVRFETEAPSVLSTGTWTSDDGIQPGFGRGETLHTDGYFQYAALVLADDSFSLPEDSVSVPIAVLANDAVAGSPGIELGSVSNPSRGTIELTDGVIYYSPNTNFTGFDSFNYTVLVDGAESQPVTVNLIVKPSHEQPQTALNKFIAAEITPSGLFLEVEKLVQIPLGENDRQPRLNAMAFTGDRVFVVADGDADGEGKVYEIATTNGTASASLFLDVGPAVLASTGRLLDNTSPQGGVRGLAFHPDFATNGKFYISVMEERPADPSQHVYISDSLTPVGVDSVVIEWTYNAGSGTVDTSSYREVFRVGMHVYDHPIKGITFNQFAQPGDEDYGLLYVGHGDGSVQSAIAGDGQNNDALGKVLRVDPLQNGIDSYTVPPTNPFVGDPTMIDEAFAIGFRNPHNLSFAVDAQGTNRLVVAEIGRDNIEEINIVTKGLNYGWAEREGPFIHISDGPGINGSIGNLPADEANNGYLFPAALLGHDGEPRQSFVAQAIAGGHVIQNGSSELNDQYVFVEFATDGRAYHVDFSEMLKQITSLDPNDPTRDKPNELTWVTPQELTILFDHDNDDSTVPLVRDSLKDVLDDEPDFEVILSAGKARADLRLGQGPNGELYVLNKRNGWIYLVTNTVAP